MFPFALSLSKGAVVRQAHHERRIVIFETLYGNLSGCCRKKEDNTMRKRLSLTFLMCIAALLCPLLIPAAYSQSVEGTFDYNYEIVYQEEAHAHTMIYAIEHEWWTGSFEGTAHAVFIVLVDETGTPTVDLLSTFTGTVHGKKGSLVIRLIGEKTSPDANWGGDWEIIRGIGELKNLRGQGTWGGPGYEGPRPPEPDWDPVGEGNTRPDIWYKGMLSTESVPEDEAFKGIVEDIFATYSSANMNADADLYMSLWDENGIKMGPGKPAVYGKSTIEEGKRKGYQKADVESQIIKVEEARVAGDWGFARGTYTASVKSKADGAVTKVEGKFLTIFKKQADGSWKIFRDCYNSNVP